MNIKNLFVYSKEFKKIMLKKNFYVVKLSFPPINWSKREMPFQYQTYKNCIFPNSKDSITNVSSQIMIIQTGGFLRSVREVLTKVRIPVFYYRNKSYIERDRRIVTTYFEANNLFRMLPYYIEAFESYNTYCDSVYRSKSGMLVVDNEDFSSIHVSNFNEKTRLDSMTLNDIEIFLKTYREEHPDVKKYKSELLGQMQELKECFLNYEVENNSKKMEKVKKRLIQQYLKDSMD